MDGSSLKSSCRQQEDSEIPIVMLRSDTCPKAVVVETHSPRAQSSKRNPSHAQARNSKSKKPRETRKKKTTAANRTTMEDEGRTISARLRNQELWEMFHREETEMIITKAGRYVLVQC